MNLHPVSENTIYGDGQEKKHKLYPKTRSDQLGMSAAVRRFLERADLLANGDQISKGNCKGCASELRQNADYIH
jgi:hypothetical protein